MKHTIQILETSQGTEALIDGEKYYRVDGDFWRNDNDCPVICECGKEKSVYSE
jgi:hypothetical protein